MNRLEWVLGWVIGLNERIEYKDFGPDGYQPVVMTDRLFFIDAQTISSGRITDWYCVELLSGWDF